MPEKFPQFDFSKKEDQEKFDASSPDVVDVIAMQSQEGEDYFDETFFSGCDSDDASCELDELEYHFDKVEEYYKIHDSQERVDWWVWELINDFEKRTSHEYTKEEKDEIESSLVRLFNHDNKKIFSDSNIQEKVLEYLLFSLYYESFEKIKIIFNTPELRLSTEILQGARVRRAISEKIVEKIAQGDIDDVREIINIPELTPDKENLQSCFKQGLDIRFLDGEFEDVAEIINMPEFELSEKFLKSDSTKENIKNGLIKLLSKDDYEELEKAREALSILKLQSLVDLFPEINKEKERLIAHLQSDDSRGIIAGDLDGKIAQEKIDTLYRVASKSLALQIFLYKHDMPNLIFMLGDTPFLFDAIIGNEALGSRLVTTYDGFDETSKHKIGILFKFQEEILVQNSDIKKDSLEFRLAMQEKLKSYAKNPEIIAELQKQGIDTENWLTHSMQDEFVLGGEVLEEISISQFIERPFNRIIGETIPEYIRIIQEEIEPYRDELGKIRVPDAKKDELQEKLEKMKNAYAETTDEQKRVGMERGIASLEKAMTSQKDVSYADKLRGAIFGLENMMENVKAKKEDIEKNEIEKNYQKVNELKKKLYIGYKTLAIRFENLQTDFEEKMTQYFSGHGEAIVQAVKTQTAEMLSHFVTDHQDLQKVFENSDFDEQIKKTKAVSLELWNRNPDVDLYLGNYSPCCISIEGGSGSDGSESAIADYLTDVSIQVLNLMDKEKNIPIMSAWLYLGVDQLGKTALVIDNIESNASQTDLYHDEIWKKVQEYISDYAKKIGVSKVVMGSSNNDIEPKNASTDRGEYRKIGPVNGNRPNGYYLESEEENDNYLIWAKT